MVRGQEGKGGYFRSNADLSMLTVKVVHEGM